MAPTRLEAFEFLRALGCTLVVLEHVFLPEAVVEYLHYEWCFSFGGLGIGLFTFISGYLIAQSLSSQSPRDYASSRLWRIYPTYLCVLGLAWAVHTYFGYSRLVPIEEVTPKGLWAQVFFVRDIFNMYNPLISGDWTLIYEVQFYVFAGLAWIAYLRWRRVRVLLVVYFGLTLIAYLYLASLSLQYLHGQAAMQRTGGSLFCFTGMMFYLSRRGLIRHGTLSVLAVWALGALAFCFFFGDFKYEYLQVSVTQLLGMAIAAVCITGNFPASRVPLVNTIAAISFPLYLLHQTFGTVGFSDIIGQPWQLGTIADRSITFVLIILPLSAAIHRLVEAPGMRLGKLRRQFRRAGQDSGAGSYGPSALPNVHAKRLVS